MAATAPRDRRSIRTLFASVDILPALLALFGPLVYVAPLATVPALLVLVLAVALAAFRAEALEGRALLVDLALFAPLSAWMLLSVAWSLDASAALSLALRLTGLFAAGIALVHWVRSVPLARLGPCLAALASGFTVASVVVLIDLLLLGGKLVEQLHAAHGEKYDLALFYGRGAAIQAILIVPLVLGLWRGGSPRLAMLQVATGIPAILVTASLSAKTALATALLAGALMVVLPRLRFALLGLLAAGVAILPGLLPYVPDPDTACWLANAKPSALHRLYIWNFTAEQITRRPAAGWGLDASRRIPGGDFPVVIHGCDSEHRPTSRLAVDSTVMPLHPHDAILQVWLELGGIGAMLGFGAVLLVLLRTFRARSWRGWRAQAGFVAACCGGLAVALISFSIWQEWFLAALFIAAAISVLAARQDERPPVRPMADS